MKERNSDMLTARVGPKSLQALTEQAEATHRTRSDYLRGIIEAVTTRTEIRREVAKVLEGNK